MEPRLSQFSIVVVGRAHNPTILNPDFLVAQGIVPPDWELEAPVIVTPPLAVVRYSNGISIQVDPNRLQISAEPVEGEPPGHAIVSIARKYVVVLPHVPYTGVGINFHSTVAHPDPGRFLTMTFLNDGPWSTLDGGLSSAGVRLGYPLDEGRLVFNLDPTEFPSTGGGSDPEAAVVVTANFHRDCHESPPVAEVSRHLDHVAKDWETHRRFLRSVFEVGNGNP